LLLNKNGMEIKMKIWLVAWGILLSNAVNGQNINKIEYFIDTDPGYGLATNVPITPVLQREVNNLSFNIPVGGLSPGAHTLYIRGRLDNGNWSLVFSKTILGNTTPLIPALTKAEFFVNTDPGIGLATNIPLTAGQTTISNLVFNIPTASLTAAADYLYVRTKDERGRWSEVYMKQLDGFPPVVPASIVKAEFFVNTDPGIGLATNIPVAVGQTTISNLAFNVPTASLTAAADYLYVRAKDERGRWSEVLMKQLDGLPTVVPASIVKAEFFVNTDPGFGLGTNIPVAAGQTSISNLAFNVPTASLTAAADYLYVRTKDERGRWSEVFMKQLDGLPPVVTASIVKAEFFVNTDPGFGLGTNIPVAAGQTTISNLAFNIPTASLTAAADYLYVRTKDERGRWSEVLMKQLDGLPTVVPASIVKAEFFVNTDPGFGLGTNIPVAAGQTSISNLAFNVPTASLTAAADYLYVRTKDERGRWSEVFMKQLDGLPPVVTASIVKAEFFVNTDPGFGLGTNIPVAAGQTTISNLAFNIPTASLTAAADYLYVRTKDERGRWSEVFMKQLDGLPTVVPASIVKAEFFVNTDPGIGLGTNIPVAAGQTTISNLVFNVPTASLTAAADYLYVRTKDERGRWSEVFMKQLDGLPPVVPASIVKAEFFVNTDPGIGLATNIPVAVGQTTISNLAFNVPTASLTAAADYLYVRAKDERGRWSEVFMTQLDGLLPVVPASIVKAEFFVNTDPGIGLATNIPVAAGQTTISNLSFNVPTASLTAGIDYLFVRTKDERGKWSEVLMQNLDTPNPVNTPRIVKMEYFVDTDPGFGLATNIALPSTGTVNINQIFVVNYGVLSTGVHTLWVRVKDERGRWSEVATKKIIKISPYLDIFSYPDSVCLAGPITPKFNTGLPISQTYNLYLSNSIGSFDQKILVGSVLTSASAGQVISMIPGYLSPGNKYKLRYETAAGLVGIESDEIVLKNCFTGNCNQTIVLAGAIDNYLNQTIAKQTAQTITASNTIKGSSNVIYKSATSILLQPQAGQGFEVSGGAVFKAEIGGCF
jgi:predicted RNA-binding protein with PUA-like domain